jgi:hypothetical protein
MDNPSNPPPTPPISLDDLIDAYLFITMGEYDHQAHIRRSTGEIITSGGDYVDPDAPTLPDDPDPDEYIQVPDRHDLDLGRDLALAFVARALPDKLDEAHRIFSRKGAYRRFKDLLHDTDTIDQWHAFEDQATRDALVAWCGEVGVTVVDGVARSEK